MTLSSRKRLLCEPDNQIVTFSNELVSSLATTAIVLINATARKRHKSFIYGLCNLDANIKYTN